MGKRLAKEVTFHIETEYSNVERVEKITFIGHSLGGLIVRAALPHLERFKFQMNGFISLCSPHLGYIYKPSKLL